MARRHQPRPARAPGGGVNTNGRSNRHQGRARAQSQEYRSRDPARSPGCDHRALRLRQILARLRHDLRRGPAPLRRIALGLRAPVPRADGKARRRFDRRPLAGNLDRAEDHLAQSPLDRRHHHRNLRLPAPALRPRRPRLLLQLRPRNHAAERPANRRSNHGMARRLAHSRARANRPRSQGRVSQGALRDEARRLRARQDRRQAPRARRGAGPQQESAPHHRGDGRSARHPQGHREAPVGLARGRVQVRPGPAQGRAPRRAQERERDLFQPALRLRRLRNFVSGNRAADVLLQQPARRLHRVLGYRFDHVFRSRADRAERGLEHRRWRDRAVGHDELSAARARRAREALQVQPRSAVERNSAEDAQGNHERLRGRGDRVRLSARASSRRVLEDLRGRGPMARSPLQGDRVRRRARVPRGLHEHAPVPDLHRRAPQEGKPVRALQQQIDFGSDRDVDQAGARVFRRAQAERAGSRNRTAHSERNSRAPQFSRRRRPRVPHPRSPVRQSLRRRGPAHPPRHPNRLEPRRRALHPRRAVDRTPSARQSAPARHPQAPQGTRQHRAGGRARSRDHARSRSSDRHGPRRRHSRRLHRLAGHARRGHARRELAHRQISVGRRSRFRCRRDAASSPAAG